MGKESKSFQEAFLQIVQQICDTSNLGAAALKHQATFFKNIHAIALKASTGEWTAGAGHVLIPNLLAMPEDKNVRFIVSLYFKGNLDADSYARYRGEMRNYQDASDVSQKKLGLVIEKCQAVLNAFLMCKRACEELSQQAGAQALILALESLQNQLCQLMGRAVLDTWALCYQQADVTCAVIDMSDDFFSVMSDDYIACVGHVSELDSASNILEQWLNRAFLRGTILANTLITLNRALCENDGELFAHVLGLKPYCSKEEILVTQEMSASLV